MDKSMSFGKRLRYEREGRHWTQEQLAERIGRSVPSINRWEHDRAEPQPDALQELTALFGKPPDRWGTNWQFPWNIPFLRNPYFTGREQTLLRLHQILAADKTVASSQILAISGLGGIGKTQTTIEYAYRYANEYEAVLWVQADSHETLVSDFAKLALTLDLREKEETDQFRMVTAVKHWLQEHRSWLVIFDNADDLAVVSDFLPRQAGGTVLLTTRSQITGPYIKKIEIEKMSREEGVTFLLRRITSSGDDDGEELLSKRVSDAEQHAAEELWEVMDGLPLALDQAGAYIEAGQCSLTEYVDLYHHHRNILLGERGGPIPEHPDAVATTWSLSFERVEQKNPAAAELLRLCAFLSPDAIPEELLTKGAAYLTLPLQELATSNLLLNKVIMTLGDYSLMRRDPETRTLSIHRLVQTVLQDTLEEATRRAWAERAMLAVNAVFPEVEHVTWPQCERLLMQALTVTQFIERYQIVSEEAGRLLSQTASYLRDRARYSEAEPLFQRALQIREQQLGPEHPDVAISLNNLAILYMYQGKYGQAEPLLRRALQIREQQPEHPDVATPLNSLATLYIHQGKYAEAEPLLRRALQIREQQLGPEHPDVTAPLNNLAILAMYQGKYAEAEPLFQRALHIWEQQLGPEHPETAKIMCDFAQLQEAWGNGEEARVWYTRALAVYEQAFGAHYPKTAEIRERLIALLQAMGQYEEAAHMKL